MPGLSDFLLDPRGQLRGRYEQNPPRPPANIPPPGASLAGVNPRLVAAVQGGATYLPPGYRIEAVSGREGRTDSRSHHSRGNAADFRIIGPDGPIPHKGEDTTGMYTHLARGVRTWALKNDPEIAGKIGYGGAFGTKIGGGGVPDLMHYDLGGSRGNMRPQVRFAMLQPLTSGEQQSGAAAVARAEPQQPARPSMPPPSGQATRARGGAISPTMAMQKLQSLGFNEAQSKAIVGNMVQESSLRPGAVTTKEGSHGLMQWRGDRFTGLQQFAKTKGTDWRDPNTQMEYIAHEMKNDPYERRQAQRFLAANTVEEANAGMKGYLRYGDNSDGKRLRYAQEIPSSTSGAMAQSIVGSPAQQAIEQAAPLIPGAAAPPVPGALAYGPTGAAAVPSPTAPPPLSPGVEPGPGVTDPRRLSPDRQPRFNSSAAPPTPARAPEPGDIQGRIDQQIEKMYGVPPPPPDPGDIQGRIDAQIDKMYGATAPPPAAEAPGPQSYLDGQPQNVPLPRPRPAEMAQASSPVSPPAAPAPQAPPARQNAQARTPAIAPSPLIRMHGTDDGTTMGRLIPGSANSANSARPNVPNVPPSLKQAIAAAVPLPRPRPGEAPPLQQGGPLSNMKGVFDEGTHKPQATGRDLDPTPYTQQGGMLSQTPPHPGGMTGLMAPDPLAAGVMQPPAAAAAAPTLGDSMANAIMNPISPTGPGQTSVAPKNPPPAWPAPGAASVPAYTPPTPPGYVSTFGSEPGVGQTFSGPQSALPWWMQAQMPGFTPQNYGAWGDIGGGGWSGGFG